MLYSTLAEFCTPATCAAMTAGPKFEYLWAEGGGGKGAGGGGGGKRPARLSAPDYVNRLFDWVEAQVGA